jgi:hypothetical protein
MAQPTEEDIRARAHALWEIAGRPEGREQEFWHEAERELSKKTSSDDGSKNPGTFTE